MEETVPTDIEAVLRLLESADAKTQAHIQLIRTTNWEQYSVGPLSSWPREMSIVLYLAMLAPQPQLLVIGDENLLLYNLAYGKMVRGLHPRILGQPLGDVEEWQQYGSQMASHREQATKEAIYSCPRFVIPMMNQGRLEDVHLRLDITLLPPPLVGFYMCFEEDTEIVLRERRRSTVRELSETWSTATDLPSLWHTVLGSLSDRPEDFPIAAVYSTRTSPESSGQQEGPGEEKRAYHLEGTLGDFDPDVFPSTFQFPSDASDPRLQPLQQAITTKSQVMLNIDNNLLESWSRGSSLRGTRDRCTDVVICPSSLTRYQNVEALLVIGLPTREVLDEAHHQHIQQVQREFADAVNSIMASTEAAYRRRDNARRHQLERDLLAKELDLRQKEAELATLQTEKVLKVIDEVQ